ncbi:putative toxin-antitoxin system toxin component, PIN family [Halobellus rubicundus]|uniref:Toxin-antitoxin system toxin component, PIN family n=1 Tax=Halobellus rubicundus TaxID=2996466 RepID=A0ABD5MBB0_9EURY
MGTVGVVLDTNVLVSALGFGGPPLEALLRALEDDVRLLASESTLDELDRVMQYDRLPFTDADRHQYLSILRREASLVQPIEGVEVARDPDDDKFLGVAIAGDADYVVSGDGDLLDIRSYRGVEIVAPDAFVDTIA